MMNMKAAINLDGLGREVREVDALWQTREARYDAAYKRQERDRSETLNFGQHRGNHSSLLQTRPMSDLTDFNFRGNYLCEILDELPSAEVPQRYFFPGNLPGGQDGLLVRVTPDGGEAWLGMFAFGEFGNTGISRVLSLPDPEKVCVVSCGAGYLVTARDPRFWEAVRAVPIIDIRAVPSAGIVVFATFTEMVAYGADGVRWRTKRLAWDGLKIVEATEKCIIGEYWDIRAEAIQRFEVDLDTGAQHGGVEG